MKIKELSRHGLLVALYIVMISFNPIGFGMIQFRVGEMLAVIPFFNKRYTMTFIVASTLANFQSPLGFIDMIVGGLCAIITYSFAKFIKNYYGKAILFALVSGLLVSAELKLVFQAPYLISLASIFVSTSIIYCLGVYSIKKNRALNSLIVEK